MLFTKPGFKEMHFPKRLRPPYLQNRWPWLLSATTGIWLAFTIAYSFAVCSTNGTLAGLLPSMTNPTMTVRVLRILSEGVALLLAALISCTLDAALWAAACLKGGISLSTILGLSRGTGISGLLELLFAWKTTGFGRDLHRFVAAIRYMLDYECLTNI
jgi:hypothetical protein